MSLVLEIEKGVLVQEGTFNRMVPLTDKEINQVVRQLSWHNHLCENPKEAQANDDNNGTDYWNIFDQDHPWHYIFFGDNAVKVLDDDRYVKLEYIMEKFACGRTKAYEYAGKPLGKGRG